MNADHVLAVLYDLSLTSIGEGHVAPLANNFLRRLVYHTGLSCGAMLSDMEPAVHGVDGQEVLRAQLCAAYGNRDLQALVERNVQWPATMLLGPAATVWRDPGDDPFFSGSELYPWVVRLPVEKAGVILLFSRIKPESDVPLEYVFAPVLASFSRAYRALRANEESQRQLELEVEVRRNTEVALREAKDHAEHASQAKTSFLSSMSHELRTPLNAILGFGQLLELGGGSLSGSERSGYVHEIISAGHHLLDLINDLLDLVRIESGVIALSIEPVALDGLLDECLMLLGPVAAKRDIDLRADYRLGAVHPVVNADRVRLKQALLNLISNAIKYNREKGEVHVTLVPLEPDRLQIRVRDNGPGIPEARQGELFMAFNRLGAESSGIEGTGIGLVITRQLVERMGGYIGFESTPGIGSTFWVEMPLSARLEADPVRVPDVAGVDAEPLPTAVQKTVLYIEDNPANLRLMRKTLSRRHDIALLDAHDAMLGLQLVEARPPHLILLDIQLSGMDGYTLLRKLRSNPETANIPVVAVSANAMPGDVRRGIEAGFDDYLVKPLQLDRLFEVLDRVLGSSSHESA